MRIAKYLAKSGLGARRKSELYVKNQEITVNDTLVTDLSYDVSDKDEVRIKGELVKPLPLVYYALNKPSGYTCSLGDKHAKRLISELVPNEPPVWPVGRLDRETSGLIILTNDGDLAYRLTHPKFEKEKEYEVVLDKPLTDNELRELKTGITLEDGEIRPDSLVYDGQKYLITIHSGKKRLVRRMFGYFNRTVTGLVRIRIGRLHLNKLKPGEWRELNEKEMELLDV